MKNLDCNQIINLEIIGEEDKNKKNTQNLFDLMKKKIRANKYIPKRLQVEEEKYKEKEPYSTYSL